MKSQHLRGCRFFMAISLRTPGSMRFGSGSALSPYVRGAGPILANSSSRLALPLRRISMCRGLSRFFTKGVSAAWSRGFGTSMYIPFSGVHRALCYERTVRKYCRDAVRMKMIVPFGVLTTRGLVETVSLLCEYWSLPLL